MDTLIKSLQNPDLFPHEIKYFTVIETHISWVLLTGDYAYKIKKPLNLGFLDFSSLEKRCYYCFEELRLNSRLAAGIYLDVIAISGTIQRPIIQGKGTVIEYAVKMVQFDPDHTFDRLLTANMLTGEQIKQTAQVIADFHSEITHAGKLMLYGNAETVMQPVRENFNQIMIADNVDNKASINSLRDWSEQQYKRLFELFNERKQKGFIRECHGDLHLANIAVIADKIVPFDGIDFNPSLYWIDVISEIAFLIMDLQNRQRHEMAFQFLNTYLQKTGDYRGLKLLHFYLVYRAVVMAKVSLIRSAQQNQGKDRQVQKQQFFNYLNLAENYTRPTVPMMIIMQGVSGSGKSWLSDEVSRRCQAIWLRSDVERKRIFDVPSAQKDSELNAVLYAGKSRNKVYQHLLQQTVEVIHAGYPVVVDATFIQQQQRQIFAQQAELLKIPVIIIHTVADEEVLIQRIKRRSEQQDNVSDADISVLQYQLATTEPLSHEELTYSISIDTEQDQDLSRLWKFIDNPRNIS